MPRTRRFLLVATLLELACASCSQSVDPPSGSSTPTTASSTPTTPTTTTPSIPAYMEKFPPAERSAYAAALNDYAIYSAKEARFERHATAPVAARRFYRGYTADWQTFWAVRRQWAAQGIRVLGEPKVLWSRPALIRLGKQGEGSIRIRQCVDATKVKVTQRGEPVPQNTTPTITTISMSRLVDDVRWKFLMATAGESC